jgi:hypothetical protein
MAFSFIGFARCLVPICDLLVLVLLYIQNIQDSLPEMRSISCWVLSRYCSLFCELGHSDDGDAFVNDQGVACYRQTLQALLAAMFDAQPKVQVAACSALSILIEQSFYAPDSSGESANILVTELPGILAAISRAFDIYGVKSSLVVVDTIGTLADSVGEDLKAPQYTALYLPKLMLRFNAIDDFGKNFPLMRVRVYAWKRCSE